MAYDPIRHRTVLFGGTTDDGNLGDTWEWDGSEWSMVAGAGPLPRSQHAMAFDPARGTVVVAGGTALADTWEWNGSQWTPLPNASFGSRFWPSMAYYPPQDRLFVFSGGTSSNSSFFLASMGQLGIDSWMLGVPRTPSPERRNRSAMVYDEHRDRFVLFGGDAYEQAHGRRYISDETWEWTIPPAPAVISHTDSTNVHVLSPLTIRADIEHAADAQLQWRINGRLIQDSLDGRIQGAATPTLHIRDTRRTDSGEYTLHVTNACPDADSNPIVIAIESRCAGDWNGDDSITSQDFFDFLGDFFQSNADFNLDRIYDSQDFFDFLAAFLRPC